MDLLNLSRTTAEFKPKAIASASVGQVHRARLHNGQRVVVKVMHEHENLQRGVNRLVIGLLAAALFVGSTHLCALPMPPSMFGVSVPGAIGCGVAILLGG